MPNGNTAQGAPDMLPYGMIQSAGYYPAYYPVFNYGYAAMPGYYPYPYPYPTQPYGY